MLIKIKLFYAALIAISLTACTKVEVKTVPMQYAGLVYDASGKSYPTVTIGTQTWMAENLATTKYNNGDTIRYVPDATAWQNIADDVTAKRDSGAFCYPDGKKEYDAIYGKLYNFYAIDDKRGVCPAGMHIPDTTAFNTLINTLGGGVAGQKLKATILWPPNAGTEGTNTSGFTALPAGLRLISGDFYIIDKDGYFSTSSVGTNNTVYLQYLRANGLEILRLIDNSKLIGVSVRCVKN